MLFVTISFKYFGVICRLWEAMEIPTAVVEMMQRLEQAMETSTKATKESTGQMQSFVRQGRLMSGSSTWRRTWKAFELNSTRSKRHLTGARMCSRDGLLPGGPKTTPP